MAKAYIIGGTPRVGKTTLTTRFLHQRPVLAASTDALRYTLRRVLKESEYPDLFHVGKFTSNDPDRRAYIRENPKQVVIEQNNESAIVWKSVVDFIDSNLEDGFDVLIEGIAALPEFVSILTCEYSAVFLGNQDPDHVQTILQAARNNPNDWMHSLDDETIKAFAMFNQVFSEYIQEESAKYNMPYIAVHDDSFEDDMTAALAKLLH